MSPQAGWILEAEIAPRLRTLIPRSVRGVGCEDAEELTQDGIAIAAGMLHNAEVAGKVVTPGNIAYYAVQHMKAGRRSTGSSVVDVLHVRTQLTGNSHLTSLDQAVEPDPESRDESLSLMDAIADDGEDPSTMAARKIDWETLCSRLSERERCLVRFVAEGKTFRDIAHALRLGESTIQTIKQKLATTIQEFMGVDILATIQRAPAWKSRERHSCRQSRRQS